MFSIRLADPQIAIASLRRVSFIIKIEIATLTIQANRLTQMQSVLGNT